MIVVLTIAGDGLVGRAGEAPPEAPKLGRREERRETLVGGAGVAQTVQPDDHPPRGYCCRHRCSRSHSLDLVETEEERDRCDECQGPSVKE